MDGTQTWMEDDLGWKPYLDRRQLWIENNPGWMKALYLKGPLMEDHLEWKKTVGLQNHCYYLIYIGLFYEHILVHIIK